MWTMHNIKGNMYQICIVITVKPTQRRKELHVNILNTHALPYVPTLAQKFVFLDYSIALLDTLKITFPTSL